MNKLINSADGAVTDVLGGETGALRGRAHGSQGAVVTADDADRPEITRSWGAPVNTPALRWER